MTRKRRISALFAQSPALSCLAVAGCSKEDKPSRRHPASGSEGSSAPAGRSRFLGKSRGPCRPNSAPGPLPECSGSSPRPNGGTNRPRLDFNGKRDPFKPFVEVQQAAKAAPVIIRRTFCRFSRLMWRSSG